MSNQRPSHSNSSVKKLSRRAFIAGSAAAGLGAVLGGCAERKEEYPLTGNPPAAGPQAGGPGQAPSAGLSGEVATPRPQMRRLGRTGLEVSCFSMGAIGANPDVLRAGQERGINFIHCAMGYGTLDRVAAAIAGRRDDVLLGLKYERAGRADLDYLNRSLEALQVDHVDILFFPLNSPQAARDRAHLGFFNQVKQQKKARFIGLTTHSDVAATTTAAVEAGFWDVLMPSYVPDPQARAGLRPVLDRAEKKNLGVVAMKTMAGIQTTAIAQMQTALKQVLADSSVTTLVKGMLSFEHLIAFLRAAGSALEERENASLRQHLASRQGQVCSLCGECPTCPRGVNVFEVMRDFDYYYAQSGRPNVARAMYQQIPAAQRGSACDNCGTCLSKCPSGVNIARHVRAADLVLG